MTLPPRWNGCLRHFLLTLHLNFRNPQGIVYGYLVPIVFLLALALAFVAQRSWDSPTNRTATLGIIFYVLALGVLAWAFLSIEWTLAPLPETGTASDMLQVRWIPLVIAVPLTLAAFLTFTNNLFTPLNVTLWVLDIICIVWGFWLPGEGLRAPWTRFKAFLKGD